MYKNKTYLAIVPARGGSKRLPRKNVLNLCGKPLIAWSIEAGNLSKYIDKVAVSSEDSEILNIAKKFKATTIKRPKDLARDDSPGFDAIHHTLVKLEAIQNYDFIVLLQPTSPLRNEKHLDKAIEFLENKNADAVISVCETDHSPLWANTLRDDLSMDNFLKDRAYILRNRSQDLEKYFRLNGAIYICKTLKLLEEKTFFLRKNIFAFKMDKRVSVDIDEQTDFEIAKFFMSKINDNK